MGTRRLREGQRSKIGIPKIQYYLQASKLFCALVYSSVTSQGINITPRHLLLCDDQMKSYNLHQKRSRCNLMQLSKSGLSIPAYNS